MSHQMNLKNRKEHRVASWNRESYYYPLHSNPMAATPPHKSAASKEANIIRQLTYPHLFRGMAHMILPLACAY